MAKGRSGMIFNMGIDKAKEMMRPVLGPPVRRIKRAWQWRDKSYKLQRGVEEFQYNLASHSSPALRPLSGVAEQLQINKVTNLQIAAKQLQGLIVMPKQTLSFWYWVKNPIARRGFLPGVVLSSGKLTSGVGGGLCQLSNLLYWMTLHTPLTITERWRHSYDVFPDSSRKVPFGAGATCAYPSLDLQIHNSTDAPYRLAVWLEGTILHGAWSSTELPLHKYRVYESAHLITNTIPGVYERTNEIRRQVLTLDGDLLEDQFLTANRALMMYSPLLGAAPVKVGDPGACDDAN